MSLAEKLYQLASFKRQYEAVLSLSVSESIPGLQWEKNKKDLLDGIDWNNLLGIASVFIQSDKTHHLDAALRVAQTCLLLDSSPERKCACGTLLENLTNMPALELAIKRDLIQKDYKKDLPLLFQLQTCNTGLSNFITIKDVSIDINRFQKHVFEAYEQNETISISAPTSAGKSFILYHLLLDELLKNNNVIIYVVPTRALISQVEEDLRALIKKFDIPNINISTVPQVDTIEGVHLFVFTQERLHWFLTSNNEALIDVLFIDEAQKIIDGNRGILLQQKIEEVVATNPAVKIYFSSPFTSNPEFLFSNLKNIGRKEKVDTPFVSVNQNLLYVDQVKGKVQDYLIKYVSENFCFDIGKINLHDRPGVSEYKKLVYIAHAFANGQGGNIIYANGSAEAEEIALLFQELIKEQTKSNEIKELIKLAKKTIHKDYRLTTVLEKGIAFHYGNMPLLIRQEIERLFKKGDIKYLICTSTLLEGVNLPSKSIFIRKPNRGNNKPMNENDFWNLAGRAGRWGKEFSGNIICIDTKSWKIPPNPIKNKQKIEKAVDLIKQKSDEFIKFLNDGSPRAIAENRQDLEFAFGYFYIKFLNQQLDETDSFEKLVQPIFSEFTKKIKVPSYILKRNPGISPLAQQNLLDYFEQKKDEIEKLIPAYPEVEEAKKQYEDLIDVIGETLSSYPPILKYSRALLLINWMKGLPLSVLISLSYANYQKKPDPKKRKPLPTVIREVMDSVEEFVRFRFAKDSSCYIDILRYWLELNEKNNLLNDIPDLTLWLEFGVSQKTHLSLLSLGLSRNTVIELAEFLPQSQLTKDECLRWLSTLNLDVYGLSPIIIEDIKKAIGN